MIAPIPISRRTMVQNIVRRRAWVIPVLPVPILTPAELAALRIVKASFDPHQSRLPDYPSWCPGLFKDIDMTSSDLGMLILIVGALCTFAGALGWASWMEWRMRTRSNN
jgi:hypothetical protein